MASICRLFHGKLLHTVVMSDACHLQPECFAQASGRVVHSNAILQPAPYAVLDPRESCLLVFVGCHYVSKAEPRLLHAARRCSSERGCVRKPVKERTRERAYVLHF